jgi:DNA replicative helicase MCM subunit Mcm2 (Cdc46/Mcm family)
MMTSEQFFMVARGLPIGKEGQRIFYQCERCAHRTDRLSVSMQPFHERRPCPKCQPKLRQRPEEERGALQQGTAEIQS